MLMKEEGILFPEDFCSKDLKRHINLIEEADLILTMTREQKERIRQFQETRGEVYTLKEFIGEKGDIADPEGYEESLYAECKEEIKSCLKKITPKILPNLDPS
jgi:protein-tyrosine-phosphatase